MRHFLGAYAYANIFIAHAADGDLDPREVAAVEANITRTGEQLGFEPSAALAILHTTFAQYWDDLGELGPAEVIEQFRESVRILASSSQTGLNQLKLDLLRVAGADENVDDMETYLIRNVADCWAQTQKNSP